MKSLLLSFLLCLSLSIFAGPKKGIDITVKLSPAGSFQISTPKVKGKVSKSGKGFKAKKLYVKIKDLKTGIELRDKHMKKRLSPKKFPKIIVTKLVAKKGAGKAIIEIKGIKKPIKFKYQATQSLFKAEFKLNLKHFKIKDLSYMGVGAEDIVTIKANVPVKK